MKQRVLILCTKNSCRSQMAEGVLRHYGSDKFDVFSAGSVQSHVNANAIRVMKEIGIDISNHRSKTMDEFLNQPFDFVITVCDNANESCPIFPGAKNRLHWSFPDPPQTEDSDEKYLKEFRKVRDMILEKFKKAAEQGITVYRKFLCEHICPSTLKMSKSPSIFTKEYLIPSLRNKLKPTRSLTFKIPL